MLMSVVGYLTNLGLYSVLIVASLWLWFRWSHRELLKTAAKIPVTFPTVPLIGHAYLAFCGFEEMTRAILEMTLGMIEKGVKTACFWVGPLPLIYLQDLADIQVILNTCEKADEYDFFITGMDAEAGPFRMHLLSAKGEVWKVSRKHLNPLFHPRNVQHMIPVFNANSRELVERISHHIGHGPFNVMEYTMDLGLKTVCNLIFGPGVSIDINSEPFKDIKLFVESIPELFIVRLLRPWLRNEFLFRLFYRNKIKQLKSLWLNFIQTPLKVSREIQKGKKPRENIFNINESNENSSTSKGQDPDRLNFLDVYTILQQNYPEFNEADLICEILGLFCTGSDTVGSGTASCLLALAQYQDIQERLYQEISSVVGHEDDVTLEDLSRMPYLEMVLKETLRWFLLVPYVLRKTTKDVTLSECTVPIGSTVACCLGAIHMDPKRFPNPTKFDPERFAPENSAGREKFAYVPFSGGPRICIAKKYASQLIKIELIHILQKFKVTTSQNIHKMQKKLIITLVSAEGYNISLEKRYPDKRLVEND